MDKNEITVREKFAQIMERYGPSVYRFALSLTGDLEFANDVYQQTFLLLLEKKPSFSHPAQLRVWLLKCAGKVIAAQRRRADNARTVSLDNMCETGLPDSSMCELYDLLSVLDEKYRQAVELFYIEDMSIRDIAAVMNLSAAAVKTRLSRARAEFKKIYKEELM